MPIESIQESFLPMKPIKSSGPFIASFITALICCLLASIASSVLIYKISAEKISDSQSRNIALQAQIKQLNNQINNFRKTLDNLNEKLVAVNEKLVAAKIETYSAQTNYHVVNDRLGMIEQQFDECKVHGSVAQKQLPTVVDGVRGTPASGLSP